MNENLIPQVIIDLATKYVASSDINEQTRLEMRINDIIEYLESVRRVKETRKKRV